MYTREWYRYIARWGVANAADFVLPRIVLPRINSDYDDLQDLFLDFIFDLKRLAKKKADTHFCLR